MTVRVCAGWLKGSVLATPAGSDTRPTGARVREAVMDMLQGVFSQARVLDLFAGSGAFAIEAISRGAQSAVLVENHPPALAVLRENLALVGTRAAKQQLSFTTKLITQDLHNCLRDIIECGPFDVVWADPPYRDVEHWILQLWGDLPHIVQPQGYFILESDAAGSTALSAQLERDGALWLHHKQKRYGLTFINILRRKASTTGEEES